MKTCLTFAIRNGERPLHLCYDSDSDAFNALREFARNIDSMPDGDSVFVEGARPNGKGAAVGFLKRDFVSIEKDSFDEGDDGDEMFAPAEDDATLVHDQHGDGGYAVESAMKILKTAATQEA